MPKPKPLRVWYLDEEPVEIRVSPYFQIQAERHFDLPMSSLNRLEHLFWMAWSALKEAGKEPRDFDEFSKAALDIEPVEDGGSVGPTPPVQSHDSSSS